jgi:hypothetical protein
MPRSEDELSGIDWRGWLILSWALAFGVRYAVMVIECRLMK